MPAPALLAHFGDAPHPAPAVACCDVCDPELRDGLVERAGAQPVAGPELDEAILEVVVSARPAVGRTRAVEILRGGRSKVIAEHGYDELAATAPSHTCARTMC